VQWLMKLDLQHKMCLNENEMFHFLHHRVVSRCSQIVFQQAVEIDVTGCK